MSGIVSVHRRICVSVNAFAYVLISFQCDRELCDHFDQYNDKAGHHDRRPGMSGERAGQHLTSFGQAKTGKIIVVFIV